MQTVFITSIGGFFTSFILAIILVRTKHLHGRYSNDNPHGVQKSHLEPTPRIGGIAIVCGFFVSTAFMPPEIFQLALLIGCAGLPALFWGLAEDFTKSISVKSRLLATIVSGLTFAYFSGYSLGDADILGLNAVLALPLVGLAFTAFAIGGVANAINLVDGFHGLATGTLVFAALAFAIIGWRVDDMVLMSLALALAGVFTGFLLVNFPSGQIFLGDGGAYFSGYLVAVLAVMLPLRNPEISPWISLLVLGYPITETLVSILRRFRIGAAGLGQPDRGHLHHIVYENLTKTRYFGLSQNALTSVVVWSLPLLALGLATFFGHKFWPAFIGCCVLVGAYFAVSRIAQIFDYSKPKQNFSQIKLQVDHE